MEKYSAWENVIIHHQISDSTEVNPVILASWERCLRRGLDIYQPTTARLSDRDIYLQQKKNRRLIEVAKPFIENLYQIVKGSGFVVILLNHEACVLELTGDKDILERHAHFRIGEFWDEERKGTNAMGLVKIERRPLQVFAEEHYFPSNHWITCSASPIWDENGHMLGILDVSGDSRFAHAHTLGMVVAATQAIENQLRLETAHSEIVRSYKNIEAIVESLSEGLISFDEEGIITQINQVALKALNLPHKSYIGSPVMRVLDLPEIFNQIIKQKKSITDQEVILAKDSRISFVVSGRPVFDDKTNVCGGVITLREIKYIHRLVNKMSGASARFKFDDILGESQVIKQTIEMAKDVANNMSSVFLQGESGTGKEMFAQAIHNASPVRKGPFVAINCASIPRDLIESELFGYEEGAFTGAKRGGRPGKFELANEGTLFLDEIGDMPLETQVSLLRVLQEKQVVRIGGYKPVPVSIRVISATHRNLWEEVGKGNFREDLYYRLNVIGIEVPSLRERKGDILILAHAFVEKFAQRLGFPPSKLSTLVMEALEAYSWPGNVRELSNVVERAIILAKGKTIELKHLPEFLWQIFNESETRVVETKQEEMLSFEDVEKKMIFNTLESVGGNISSCAKILGIGRSTLYRKLEKYKIQ